MKTNRRTDKLSSLIKALVASAIEDMVQVRDTIISVTEVNVSPDCKRAIVWFSIYGSNPEQAKHLIDELSLKIQNSVAQKCQTKFTPKLQFCFDDRLEYADKINQIIKKIK